MGRDERIRANDGRLVRPEGPAPNRYDRRDLSQGTSHGIGRKSPSLPIKYDKRRYKRRNRIEIMFGRLKDWRRMATRYDRSPTVFFSALALSATVLFWL